MDGMGGGLLMNLGRATTMASGPLLAQSGCPGSHQPRAGRGGGGGAHCVAPLAHYTPSSSTGLLFPRRPGRPEPVTRHRVAGGGALIGTLAAFQGGMWEDRGRQEHFISFIHFISFFEKK